MSLAATEPRHLDASGCRDLGEAEETADFVPSDGQAPKQELLPPLRWLQQPDIERFAHPAEIELARLLTFYGVRWAYEPTTFALRWDGAGNPEQLVTPDFYLPDHDLYLELTTMRQRLVTRKNRKFRMLREHYPNVQVRILYLRDFERIQRTYGSPNDDGKGRIGTTLFAAEELEARVAELAEHLVATWDTTHTVVNRRPLLLGVGEGSRRFLASLGEQVRAQGVPVDLDRIDLSTIVGQQSDSRVRVSRSPTAPIAGRPVVVVQEVLSTGLSAAFIDGWLRRHGATHVEVCALLDRETARILDVPVTCRGFAAPDVSMAGYGLTRWREYRDLPFVAEIERK